MLQKKSKRPLIMTVFWLAIIIGALEFSLIMLIHQFRLPPLVHSAIDSLVLIILVSPILYYFIARRRQAKELYQTLAESSPIGVYIVQDGQFKYVNPQFQQQTGYSEDELLTMNSLDVVYPEDRQMVRQNAVAMLQGKLLYPYEFRVVNRTGGIRWAMETVAYIHYKGKRAVLGYFMDITERKLMEETLKDNETELSAIFDNSPIVMILMDSEYRVRRANRAAVNFTKRPVSEMLGVRAGEAFRCILHLDDPRGCGFGPSCGSCGFHNTMMKTFESGKTFIRVETELVATGDRKQRALNLLVSSVLLEDSQETLVLVCIEDITVRKQMEEQLRHSQVLASLGEMTAGIAHEVGNPLASIVLYSEAAMKGADDPRQTKKDLKVIHDEARRAGKLMKDLLAYSRKLEPNMRRMNLNKVTEKVIGLRRYQEKVKNISITADLLKGPLNVKGDAAQLTQVFLNLIMNAEEAVNGSGGGKVTVKSSVEDGWVKVSIVDDGPGIPKENLDQIFLPFFTTKDVGEGTGLGLSTCYGIISAHNGVISAENNEDGGATFTVYLPLMGKGRQGALPLETE